MPDSSEGRLPAAQLQAMIELADCGEATANQLLDAVRRDKAIRKHRPEGDVRVDPRDGMPIVYSMARAKRPHDARPAEDGGGLVTSDAATCPVCQGQTTGILDVAKAGPGVTFINKNLFPVMFPERGKAPPELFARRALASQQKAVGGHYLQWTSDVHDIDLHNASPRHVEVVFERLAAFERALLTTGEALPAVPHRGERLHGYVGIIKNRGRAVGGSLVHGHQQVVHTNVRPLRTQQHMEFLAREGRGAAAWLRDETPEALVLADLGGARWLTPFCLRRVLQTVVVPDHPTATYLHELPKKHLRALARGVRLACRAATELMPTLGREVAYNLLVHNGPIGGVYVELLPWTQQYGGYEQLGVFLVQGTPEYSHELIADWIAAR